MKTNKLPSPLSLFAILMFALGLSSCSAEMQNEELDANATLFLNTNLNTLGIKTGAEGEANAEANESSIKELRVLVYEAFVSGGITTYGDLLGNSTLENNLPSEQEVTLRVEFKKRNNVEAFLIANEDPYWALDTKTYNVDELKKLTIAYGSNVAAPFKMFEKTGVFAGQANISRKVSLIRNVARVDVELTCNVADKDNMLAGGKLQLTNARILKMAKTTQLGEAIDEYNFGKGGYVDGPIIKFTEHKNYVTTYENDKFTGFTTLGSDGEAGSLTFYVPEHFVKEVGTHTYMAIEGKYYPAGSDKVLNVAYTLPIGFTVTTEKITGTESFTPEDLKITRNYQYNIKANIKKIEQISEVVVSVQPWEEKKVDGSIENGQSQYSLNVSSLHTSIAQGSTTPTLVQFWSNQPSNKVRVLPSGSLKKIGADTSEPFSVNSIFVALTDIEGQARPENLWFNDTTVGGQGAKSWGHLKLILHPEATGVVAGNIYTITLAAGALHRTIKIEIPSTVLNVNESK